MSTVRVLPSISVEYRRLNRVPLFARFFFFFWQALAFAERNHLREDMYVIARVWGIGTPEPKFLPYLDPHQALISGYLQYASDVYLQRSLP
jgi:hypothetical protein